MILPTMSEPYEPPSQRPDIKINAEEYEYLRQLSMRTSEPRQAKRARFILAYAHGLSVADAARTAGFSRPVAYRWLDRVCKLGVRIGISDKPYEVKARPSGSREWVLNIAASKPTDVGLPLPAWTTDTLARYIRTTAAQQGHPEMSRITNGGVRRILASAAITLEPAPPSGDV